ncbi:hypothetical protein IKD56_01675 [bacterium]|nr:hypothetical protein [bacterium]
MLKIIKLLKENNCDISQEMAQLEQVRKELIKKKMLLNRTRDLNNETEK